MFNFITTVGKLLFSRKSKESAIDVAKKGTESLINGLDKMWFTKEEKFEGGMKMMNAHLDLIKATAGENTERSRTRRQLAVDAYRVYFGLILAAAGVHGFNAELAKAIFSYSQALNFIIGAVTIFFFGSYAAVRFLDAKNGKGK